MHSNSFINFKESCVQTVLINKYNVLIVLFIIKIKLFQALFHSSIAVLRQSSLGLCLQINRFQTEYKSMVDESLDSLSLFIHEMTNKSIQVLGYIFNFIVDLFLGTYVCLLDLMITSTTRVSATVAEEIVDVVNNTITTTATELNKQLSTVASVINRVGNFFSDDNFKAIDLTIDSLKNWQIPSSVDEKIRSLNNVDVNLDGLLDGVVSNVTDKIIKTRSLPEKRANESFTLNEACSSDAVADFYDVLHTSSNRMFTLILILSVGSIVVVTLVQLWLQNRSFRHIREIDEKRPNMEVVSTFENRYIHKYCGSGYIKWLMLYICSSPSINILVLFFFSLFSYIIQVAIVNKIQNLSHDWLADGESYDNDNLNQYVQYQVKSYETYINNNMTLASIHNTFSSVNSTMNDFITDVNGGINSIFKDSIIGDMVNGVVYCVIGRKLEAVNKGFDWLTKSTELQIPTENYVISNQDQDDLMSKMAEGISALCKYYKQNLTWELWQCLLFGLLWMVQLMIGILISKFQQQPEQQCDDNPFIHPEFIPFKPYETYHHTKNDVIAETLNRIKRNESVPSFKADSLSLSSILDNAAKRPK
ncbi:Membrane fusion during mating [Komagataella phaffii CBS 7435]|uniref:Plasma membrane fusion protein PRM1 n=2 Tax=Komagataella phaffii TaxID=460519 RepID=C4QWT6_KOMPG|nr:Pheromone-regulated multispanning membrane protein involved in membrane fusion during mating [Komagataella phaffii GS115]AOA60534.1 GQ67_02917T0 [Komagataella phaffii]CAH2446501.1 Membrane fusion during mating [Komagataella phaffii CBS 7435]AOA65871.1 GQ68_02330T0 [Komagataella phaffii GS115]CAY67709.1 Pheromone-regulated multispanning membrane protein involved in membrane fusion during mating [Komagataella phaffii GS115]CCA36801.2 Membrane fusion during mating [Komagataella phaffii CBS 743